MKDTLYQVHLVPTDKPSKLTPEGAVIPIIEKKQELTMQLDNKKVKVKGSEDDLVHLMLWVEKMKMLQAENTQKRTIAFNTSKLLEKFSEQFKELIHYDQLSRTIFEMLLRDEDPYVLLEQLLTDRIKLSKEIFEMITSEKQYDRNDIINVVLIWDKWSEGNNSENIRKWFDQTYPKNSVKIPRS